MSKKDFKPGVMFSVQWLHQRALSMNDPHARAILNSAAFHLGQARAGGKCEILPPGYRIMSPEDVEAVRRDALEEAAKVADEYVWDDHALAQATGIGRAVHHQSIEIATAIRALKETGR